MLIDDVTIKAEAGNGGKGAVAFLLVFVISAAIMGLLIFGKPALSR